MTQDRTQNLAPDDRSSPPESTPQREGGSLGSEVSDREQLTAEEQLRVEDERSDHDLTVEGSTPGPHEHDVGDRSTAQDGQAS